MYRFFLAANIWCPVAEYALMRVLSDPSVFLAWASLCSLVFPLLERWQRIDLISSKADGIQNEFLPLAGKRSWDKSRVAGRGRASVLMDSLMRSLSTAQRLTVRLSGPLLVSPNTCFINNRTPHWCWMAQRSQEKRHDGGTTPERRIVFNVFAYLLGLSFFSGVSSTNRSVGFWHQRLCCQMVEHDTRSYLIVNSKNKSITLLQLRLHHF